MDDKLPIKKTAPVAITLDTMMEEEGEEAEREDWPSASPHRPRGRSASDGGTCLLEGDKAEGKKELLLPRTADVTELWPAILTKAILKVAVLE